MKAPGSTTTRTAKPAALTVARAAAAARRRADLDLLTSALTWCRQHIAHPAQLAGAQVDSHCDFDRCPVPATPPIETRTTPAALYGDQAVRLAGDGAPLVWSFSVDEFSAAVGFSTHASISILGDVLDLAYRFPQTWARVLAGRLSVSLARQAVQCAHDLSLDAARHADAMIARQPGLNPNRIRVLVDEARLYADPDRRRGDEDNRANDRRVDVRHGQIAPGASEVNMVLDTEDAAALDQTLDDLATVLGRLGHTGDRDHRRAAAVGKLADPQTTLDLLHPDAPAPTPAADPEPGQKRRPVAADRPADVSDAANPFRRTHRPEPEVTVVLHLSDHALLTAADGGDGVVTHQTLSAFTMDQVAAWLANSQVTIKPVLDPHLIKPVDRHDPPQRMLEAMRLRDPVCVFPGCSRDSTFCDGDHIVTYVPLEQGGPPGQTRLENLAPLCRGHHRAKTHGGFSYRRLPDGAYEWTLPSGIVVITPTPPESPEPPEPPRRPDTPR